MPRKTIAPAATTAAVAAYKKVVRLAPTDPSAQQARQRIAVLAEALQVTFDCLADVLGCFRPGSALGNTSRQSRANCNEHPVLVWF